MRYRKKPVIVEALQIGFQTYFPRWFFDKVTDYTIIIHKSEKSDVCDSADIKTLEGVMHASKGDYIILGVNEEVYPCKPDIFEKLMKK